MLYESNRYPYLQNDDYYLRDLSNGNGVQMFVPLDARDYGSEITYQDATVFPEAQFVVNAALKRRSQGLLVEGEPGSGKSHLSDDLMFAVGAANNAPAMSLSLHVVGGSAAGLENAQRYVEQFKNRIGDNRGLIIFDNLDYLGYKGHRRANRTREFATGIADLVKAVLDNPRLVTIGNIHDPDWRTGQWTWQDDEINNSANRALRMFEGEPYKFEGKLSVLGLVQTVLETWPGIPEELAINHVGELAVGGLADFFHARHVDPVLYASAPDKALAQARNGRAARKNEL